MLITEEMLDRKLEPKSIYVCAFISIQDLTYHVQTVTGYSNKKKGEGDLICV